MSNLGGWFDAPTAPVAAGLPGVTMGGRSVVLCAWAEVAFLSLSGAMPLLRAIGPARLPPVPLVEIVSGASFGDPGVFILPCQGRLLSVAALSLRGGVASDGTCSFPAGNRRAFFARFVRYVDRE